MADWDAPFGSVRNAFWAYVGLCLGTTLLAFLPDRTSLYDGAITELEQIGTVRLSPQGIADAIGNRLVADLNSGLAEAIRRVAGENHLELRDGLVDDLISPVVLSGTEAIDFDLPLVNVFVLADRIKSNEPYAILVPEADSIISEFKRVIHDIDTPFRNIVTFDVGCDREDSV
jgi:hypothetical protein